MIKDVNVKQLIEDVHEQLENARLYGEHENRWAVNWADLRVVDVFAVKSLQWPSDPPRIVVEIEEAESSELEAFLYDALGEKYPNVDFKTEW